MKYVLLQCCAIAYGCTHGYASAERRWYIQRMFLISVARTNISLVSFELIALPFSVIYCYSVVSSCTGKKSISKHSSSFLNDSISGKVSEILILSIKCTISPAPLNLVLSMTVLSTL